MTVDEGAQHLTIAGHAGGNRGADVGVTDKVDPRQRGADKRHPPGPVLRHLGGDVPGERDPRFRPVDVAADGPAACVPCLIHPGSHAAAQVVGGPVALVAEHGTDRAKQARFIGAAAGDGKGLVQMDMRLDQQGKGGLGGRA